MTTKIIEVASGDLMREESEARQALRSCNHYSEFLGGMGDVLNRMHQCDWYVSLTRLPEGTKVAVAFMSHNPAGLDFFRWIPSKAEITVLNMGFTEKWNDPAWRSSHGLPEKNFHPYAIGRVDYHPSPEDERELDQLNRIGAYVALVASAGTPERNLRPDLRERVVDRCLEKGYKVVSIGGNYQRRMFDGQRDCLGPRPHEEKLVDRIGVHQLVDKLSAAGSVKVLERAAGAVVTHTALCLAAWYVRTPTFLLYSADVKRLYVPLGFKGYLFGAARPGNDHMEFSEYADVRLTRFLENL